MLVLLNTNLKKGVLLLCIENDLLQEGAFTWFQKVNCEHLSFPKTDLSTRKVFLAADTTRMS